jgi:hypothetical protein
VASSESVACSVKDYIGLIKDITEARPGFYTYRGTKNIAWNDVPGILREERKNLLIHEPNAIRELQSIHPQEFATDNSMFDKLVRAQHFSLPTRLLDVTGNPLVALYFASETSNNPAADGKVSYIDVPRERIKYFDSNIVSCLANLSNLSVEEKDELRQGKESEFRKLRSYARLLECIRLEKPRFRSEIRRDDLLRIWYVVAKLNNRRILAQRGAFLIFGLTSFGESETGIRFDHIRIPKEEKQNITKDLNALGINRGALFPEIQHAAEDIVTRYQ